MNVITFLVFSCLMAIPIPYPTLTYPTLPYPTPRSQKPQALPSPVLEGKPHFLLPGSKNVHWSTLFNGSYGNSKCWQTIRWVGRGRGRISESSVQPTNLPFWHKLEITRTHAHITHILKCSRCLCQIKPLIEDRVNQQATGLHPSRNAIKIQLIADVT